MWLILYVTSQMLVLISGFGGFRFDYPSKYESSPSRMTYGSGGGLAPYQGFGASRGPFPNIPPGYQGSLMPQERKWKRSKHRGGQTQGNSHTYGGYQQGIYYETPYDNQWQPNTNWATGRFGANGLTNDYSRPRQKSFMASSVETFSSIGKLLEDAHRAMVGRLSKLGNPLQSITKPFQSLASPFLNKPERVSNNQRRPYSSFDQNSGFYGPQPADKKPFSPLYPNDGLYSSQSPDNNQKPYGYWNPEDALSTQIAQSSQKYPAPPADGNRHSANGYLLKPDGAYKLGPHFKGIYVPDDMANEIQKWMKQLEKDKAEAAKSHHPMIATAYLQYQDTDPNVDTKTINAILSKLGGFRNQEKGPWNPKDKAMFDICLKLHNQYRAKHYAPPVQYDERINKIAQNYADKLLQNVMALNDAGMKHSYYQVGGVQIGENLAWNWGTNLELTAKNVVETAVHDWYNEVEEFYDFGQPQPMRSKTARTGHFTALVWRDTKYIGLGVAKGKAPDGQIHYTVVVNYDPAGNVNSQYKENVLQPGKYPKGPPALKYHHMSIFPDHCPEPRKQSPNMWQLCE